MSFLRLHSFCWLGIAVAVCAVGCRTTVKMTDTSETGTQQLLLNNSVDTVVSAIDFCPLAHRDVYLDTNELALTSNKYLPYRIREQMAISGVRLAESREDAEIVVYAGLAAYGTDSNTSICGITETDQFPELNLCVRHTQYGLAKLSMFGIDKETGTLFWQAGPLRSDSCQKIGKVLGTGPYYSGSIQHPAVRTRRCSSR